MLWQFWPVEQILFIPQNLKNKRVEIQSIFTKGFLRATEGELELFSGSFSHRTAKLWVVLLELRRHRRRRGPWPAAASEKSRRRSTGAAECRRRLETNVCWLNENQTGATCFGKWEPIFCSTDWSTLMQPCLTPWFSLSIKMLDKVVAADNLPMKQFTLLPFTKSKSLLRPSPPRNCGQGA